MKKTYGILMVVFFAITSIFNYGCSAVSTKNEKTEDLSEEKSENVDVFDNEDEIQEGDEETDYLEPKENCITIIVELGDMEVVSIDNQIKDKEITGEINEITRESIKKSNEKIINYLKSKDVDITEKLSGISNVYTFKNNPNNDFEVELDSFYDPETKAIYLNEDIVDNLEYADFCYTFSTLLYLLDSKNSNITILENGMASALAEKILGYTIDDFYSEQTIFAHQMLISDPDIVNYIFSNNGRLADRIDSQLEDVKKIWMVKKYNFKMSEVMDIILSTINNVIIDEDMYVMGLMQMQNIMLAYCKTFNLTEEQEDELSEYLIEFIFGDESEQPYSL